MKKIFNIVLLAILCFMCTGLTVDASTYQLQLIPYNVTEACDLEEDGGQFCYEEFLNGNLESYRITDGNVEKGWNIMIVQKIVTPGESSEVTSFQYAVKFDTTKVDYYMSSFGVEFGTIHEQGGSDNLGYLYGPNGASETDTYFPFNIVGSGRNQKKVTYWAAQSEVVSATTGAGLSDGIFQEFVFQTSDDTFPLKNSTPTSALFFNVKADSGSNFIFEYYNDPEYTAVSGVNGSLQKDTDLPILMLSVIGGGGISNDGTLADLEAKGNNNIDYLDGKFIPADKMNLEYSITVPYSVNSITFTGTPNDSTNKGKTGFDTPNSLAVGENPLNVSVTAANGSETIYLINVYRLNNDATIKTISNTNGISFGNIVDGTLTYNATVPYKTTNTNTTITLNDTNATLDNSSSYYVDGLWNIATDNNTNKLNTYTVKVNAENCNYSVDDVPGNVCDTKTYTFNITRTAPSKNVNLSTLLVDGVSVPGFNENQTEYTLTAVNYSKTSVEVSATVADSLNKITSGTGTNNLNVGDNQIKVVVTGEDGTTKKEYKINIYRKSNDTALQSLTITSNPQGTFSPSFRSNLTDGYKYEYDPNVTTLTINGVAKDTGKAKVSIVDLTSGTPVELVGPTLNTATTTVGITVKKIGVIVTPEDESVSPVTYTVDLSRRKSTNNYLQSLSITPGTIIDISTPLDPTKGTYNATVDADVSSVTVNAELADPLNAKGPVITGNSGFNFGPGNIISITVTSESGIVNTYTINVTRKKYDIATLDEIRVGFNTAESSSTPININSYNPTINNHTEVENGENVEYIEYTLYTESKPLALANNGIKIEYDLTNNLATASGDVGVKALVSGNNTYTINVVSHDEEVKYVYKIHVYRQKNPDNSTQGVSVAGVAAHTKEGEDQRIYYVTLPNSKETLVASEVVISAAEGARVVKDTQNLDLSTKQDNIFNYSVTSESGVTENYEIHITREPSSNKTISLVKLRVDGEETASRSCTFDTNVYTCTISVPTGTTGYYLEPVIDPSATVTPVSTTHYTMDVNNPADSVQTRILTVKAENDDEQDYTIKVERTKSGDADLASITLTDVTSGKNVNIPINNFSKTKTNYNITVTGDVEDIKIDASLADGKASLETTLPGYITLSFNQNNQFTINIRAENGTTTKSYVLNITRQAKIDNTLQELKVSAGSNELKRINGFASSTTAYLYSDVDYDNATFNIDAIVTDNLSDATSENAIIESIILNDKPQTITQGEEVNTSLTLKTGTNKIKIVVAAQNRNEKKEYTITVDRKKNTDTGIKGIKVANIDATVDPSDPHVYTVEVPNNVTIADENNVVVTPNDGANPDDKLATPTVVSTALKTLDEFSNPVENIVNITVTAENGKVDTYVVKVKRTPSDVSKMTSVNIYSDATPDIPRQCIFTDDVKTCTVDVNTATTSINITEKLVDETASVTYNDGTNNGRTLPFGELESSKIITATVTAENGYDFTEYTITINRADSANAYLKTIKTNANQSDSTVLEEIDGFSIIEPNYEITVPGTTNKIKIYAESYDKNSTIEGSGILTPASTVTYEVNLDYGVNTITLTGVAQNGTTRFPYTIKVTREKNIERRLKNIKIDGVSIDNFMTGVTFDPDVREYTLDILDYNDYVKSVTAEAMDEEYGTVDNTGSYDIETIYFMGHDDTNPYLNDIVIRSYAHNTDLYYDYTIHIKRRPSNKTDISKVEVLYNGVYHEATYDSNKDMYILENEVPNSFTEANDTNIRVTPKNGYLNSDNLATVSMNPTTLVTDDEINENVNIHNMVVTAEDGTTTKNIKLQITRAKSSESRLSDISIVTPDDDELIIGTLDPVFNKDTIKYNVIVGQDVEKIRVKYEMMESHEKVTKAGDYDLTSSEMTIIVTSISEDGKNTSNYELKITRLKNINNSVSSIKVTGSDNKEYDVTPTIDPDLPLPTRYYVTVPGSVESVTLDVKAANKLADVSYVGPDAGTTSTYSIPVGTTTVQFNIISESSITQRYYLEITREPKADATLKNLGYQLYKANTVADIGMINLNSPDEEPNIWYIPNMGTTLDNEYTRIIFNAQANDGDDATVSGSIGMQNIKVGENTYKIIVTAEDKKTTKEYIIKATRNASSDATLKLLDATGYTLDPQFTGSREDYDLTVSEIHDKFSCTDLSYMTTHPQATVACDSEVNLSTTSPTLFNVTVTAEDRVTTKTYKLHITRPKSTDNTLKNVKLTNGSLSPTFLPTLNEYTISVPYGATSFEIEGIKNIDSQTVNGNGSYNIADLVDEQVIISVQAEDSSITVNNYVFHVVQAQSNDGSLSNLYVAGYPFQPLGTSFSSTNYTYTLGGIDRSINQVNVYATPNNVDAKIEYYYDSKIAECDYQPSCLIDLTPGLGQKSITVKVTPADQSVVNVKDYIITYNKVASSDANLTSLTSSEGSFDKAFNIGTQNYILTVPNEIDSLDLTMVTENPYANISITEENGDNHGNSTNSKTATIDDLPEGVDYRVTITVTAETGTIKNYYVLIRRSSENASDDNYLASLSVTDYEFKAPNNTFNSNNLSYSIGQIPYNVNELTINAIANDANAVISYYVDGVLQSSNIVEIPKNPNATITVKVIAENGSPKDYIITLSKNPNSDATLKNLIVSKGTLSPAFNRESSTRTYEVTIPNSETSIDITGILNDSYAVATLNGVAYVSGTATTIRDLKVGRNTNTFVITAENGTTTQTYKLVVIREGESEVITSVKFGHTIEDGYIKTGILNHTAANMKDELDNDNSKLEIWSADDSTKIGDTDLIGTGMIVKLIVNGKVVDSKIIVVKGDTTGDGIIGLLDAIVILNHYLEITQLSGAYKEAADTNTDADIGLLDAINILNHYLELNLISYIR